MMKAFQLEWLKVRYYKTFWVLIAMYFLALAIICFGGMFFLEYLKAKGLDFKGLNPTMLPIYDFPDIWQNITYLGSFLRIIIAFIVIISITNDLTYNTLRQNIIDGISKKEYLTSKLAMIFILGTVSTLFVFAAGLINGAIYSRVWGWEYVFRGTSFLFAYCYGIIIFSTLAFALSLLIKKAGFAIVSIFLYAMMFEPLLVSILEHAPPLRETIAADISQFLPLNAINNLIAIPFPRYVFQEIVDHVPWSSLLIATGWFGIFVGGILWILTKRDLK